MIEWNYAFPSLPALAEVQKGNRRLQLSLLPSENNEPHHWVEHIGEKINIKKEKNELIRTTRHLARCFFQHFISENDDEEGKLFAVFKLYSKRPSWSWLTVCRLPMTVLPCHLINLLFLNVRTLWSDGWGLISIRFEDDYRHKKSRLRQTIDKRPKQLFHQRNQLPVKATWDIG